MSKRGSPIDILGIGQQKVFQPYKTDDGWLVVTPGAESGRRQARGKIVVALSKVLISLRSKSDVAKCVTHLEESDRRFAMIASNPWDWAPAAVKGLKVRFNVEWYDMSFFHSKKQAYLSSDHQKFYQQFGATVDNISVNHFQIDSHGVEHPDE